VCERFQLNSSLARPHDLTCQVCEKHCADEVRFFCHIHKYHPDYWRVFSGGRPLSDFIESTGPDDPDPASSSPGSPSGDRQVASAPAREKRYSCSVCHKRYCNQTGFVKHMAAHPGLAHDLLSDGDAARMALYSCVVCSKLFTKEAYLLRHMEMKLDPAHAAGLEQLKKSSAMFRSSAAVAAVDVGCRPPSSYDAAPPLSSRSASVDNGDAERGRASPGPSRYADDSKLPLRRSTSCVSPLSTSSASPVSPPPMTSFLPYSTPGRDERRAAAPPPSTSLLPDADALRYSAAAAAAAAAAADYHLRRGGIDYSPSLTPSYRAPPPPPGPRSPPADDDCQPGSSPEADDGRRSYAGPERRRHDYYSPASPTFNRFQPYVPPPQQTSLSAIPSYRPQYSFYRANDTPQPPLPPPHLPESYLRRSSNDLDDRRPVHGFR